MTEVYRLLVSEGEEYQHSSALQAKLEGALWLPRLAKEEQQIAWSEMGREAELGLPFAEFFLA